MQESEDQRQTSSRSVVSTKRPRPSTLPPDMMGDSAAESRQQQDPKQPQFIRSPPAEDPSSDEDGSRLATGRRSKPRPPAPPAPVEPSPPTAPAAAEVSEAAESEQPMPVVASSRSRKPDAELEQAESARLSARPLEGDTEASSTARQPTSQPHSTARTGTSFAAAATSSRPRTADKVGFDDLGELAEQQLQTGRDSQSAPQTGRPKAVAQISSDDLARCGRLSIRCLAGKGFAREEGDVLDISLAFRLGGAAKFPWKQTAVHKKVSQTANFDQEVRSRGRHFL